MYSNPRCIAVQLSCLRYNDDFFVEISGFIAIVFMGFYWLKEKTQLIREGFPVSWALIAIGNEHWSQKRGFGVDFCHIH